MNPTTDLYRSGQSLWLDNITRELLDSGRLERYIAELSVIGLTSNPTIYEKAIRGSDAYAEQIRRAWRRDRKERAPLRAGAGPLATTRDDMRRYGAGARPRGVRLGSRCARHHRGMAARQRWWPRGCSLNAGDVIGPGETDADRGLRHRPTPAVG